MTKTGWWSVKFDITLEGEEVRFEDLSESSQEHILECIRDGCVQGEVVEEEAKFVMLLTIYPDSRINHIESEFSIVSRGDSIEELKSRIDELIKAESKAHSFSGECTVEMLIERGGEYYDSDNARVNIDPADRSIKYLDVGV